MPLTTTAVADDRAPGMTTGNGQAADAGSAARTAVRTRAVLVYVAIALAALVPGLLSRFDITFGSLLDVPLLALKAGLDDIRFGSGLRFWLGVSGATMMGLLLLYPLRKLLSRNKQLGSVGGWFHVHMIMGLGGPVAVLYHANFGHGGTNANVALWCMITVAVSGILGYFIYGRASAEFYSVRQRAREQLEAITDILDKFAAMPPAKRQLINEMETFEAELLTPRQGVIASVAARLRMEQRRVRFARAIDWLMGQYAREARLEPAEHHRLRAALFSHLQAFMRVSRHASSRSIREQIWARWRLFHLPVFLVMVIAVVLHVRAVWDMGGDSDRRAAASQVASGPPSAPATALPRTFVAPGSMAATNAGQAKSGDVIVAPIARRPVASSQQVLAGAMQSNTAPRTERTIEDLLAESPRPSSSAAAKQPGIATPQPLPAVRGIATIPVQPGTDKPPLVQRNGNAEPKAVPTSPKAESTPPLPPRPAESQVPAPIVSAAPLAKPVPSIAPQLPPAPAPRVTVDARPPEQRASSEVKSVEARTAALSGDEPRRSSSIETVRVPEQLPLASPIPVQAPVPTPAKKASPAAQPASTPESAASATAAASASGTLAPATGAQPSASPAAPTEIKTVYAELQRKTEEPPMALGGGKRSLDEQIATLKAKMAAKQFFHSEAETGFMLSGKHMKLDCTSCHSKPLKETPSNNPRQCVDCHKKDDVHKGRQPDCASCHTTNRWTQILKRK